MKTFINYVIATVLLLGPLCFYIPVHYDTRYPKEIGPQFDKHIRKTYIDFLEDQQPDVFFLGDSMPGQGIDETMVSKLLDKRVLLVSLDGTASTIWYLIIKNNVILAEHKPRYLVVFFRDSMMTVPSYRVTGRYLELIDEFASPADTLLIERAYINQAGPLEQLMERYVPLYGSRLTIRESIDYYVRYPLGNTLLNCNKDCTDRSMDVVFEQKNLDPTFFGEAIDNADSYLYTRETLNFDKQIDKSFLPEIIRLCKGNDIQLILVRMPTLRFNDPKTKPPGLDSYIRDLSKYLQKNNIQFLDFDRKNMPQAYFKDTLHLNEKGRIIFTQQLTETLGSIIK